MKQAFLKAASFLLWAAYAGYFRLVPDRRVIRPEQMPWRRGAANAIYVGWHAKTFMILPFCRGSGLVVLTLRDWKNRVYDGVCRRFGYRTVPVASASVAASVLRRMLEAGHHVALAIDGPRGPAGVMKPGAFYLARKTGRPIIAIRIEVERSWRIRRRWDRFEIPKPGSRAVGILSEPIEVREENLEEARARVLQALGPP